MRSIACWAVRACTVHSEPSPVDMASLALLLGATYVGRSFSGDKRQLVPLIKGALAHQGKIEAHSHRHEKQAQQQTLEGFQIGLKLMPELRVGQNHARHKGAKRGRQAHQHHQKRDAQHHQQDRQPAAARGFGDGERGGEPGWLPLGFGGRRWSVVVEKAAQRSNNRRGLCLRCGRATDFDLGWLLRHQA